MTSLTLQSRSSKKPLITLCVVIGLMLAVIRVYYLFADHSLSNIRAISDVSSVTVVSTSTSDVEEVNRHLQQRYFYLSRGAQTYVFISEDGNHILKFIKHKHYRLTFLERIVLTLPFFKDFREAKMARKHERLMAFLTSCALSYNELKEETGLEYVHLHPTDHVHGSVTLVDWLGRSRDVSLDDLVFVMQQKAEPLRSRLQNHLKLQNFEEALHCIDSVVAFLDGCSERGFADTDKKILDNLGFVEERTIFLDLGGFVIDPNLFDSLNRSKFLTRYLQSLNEWLQEDHQEFAAWLTTRST